MNTLERSLIEKAGADNGWEYVCHSSAECVRLAFNRHSCEATVLPVSTVAGEYLLSFSLPIDTVELMRGLPDGIFLPDGSWRIWDVSFLGDFLRRVAELLTALPNQPLEVYLHEIDRELAGNDTIRGTEAERLVRMRVGQDLYRKALLSYWKGQCAVTGISIPEILRASHAKPWADCDSDAERLNVYNGFLLAAHLDALFDAGFISFTDSGRILLSSTLAENDARLLNIDKTTHLRWIDARHQHFLSWHRDRVFRGGRRWQS